MNNISKSISIILLFSILLLISTSCRPLATMHNDKATEYRMNGQYDLAMAEYEKIIELDPDYYSVYVNKAQLYVLEGEYDKAFENYDKAFETASEDWVWTVYYDRGFVYYAHLEQYEKAIDDFSKVIELNPQNVLANVLRDTYSLRAGCYEKIGKHDLAAEDLRKAGELNKE